MADITSTSTLVKSNPSAGGSVIAHITATLTASTDTIVLTEASHGITGIDGILGVAITGGLDAAFTGVQVSYSGLTITVASFEQDGTAATDWTGTTVSIGLIGSVD